MLFSPADILLPRNADLTRWAVVACDQFTSQPDYWARADEFVGGAPSTLRLILPEYKLEQSGVAEAIDAIRAAMAQYVKEDCFTEHKDALFYIERTLPGGRVRRGLLGKLDLEAYDYRQGAVSPVRATEGTVLGRIPPRLAVRRGAELELPHVLMLFDDPDRTVIEPIAENKCKAKLLYNTELMEGGGSVAAWKLGGEEIAAALAAIDALADPGRFAARYGAPNRPVLLLASGDGNHSLATAKAYYEELKQTLSPAEAAAHPARYALVELCNLHDDAMTFEAIERVVFDIDPAALVDALLQYYPGAHLGEGAGHRLPFAHAGGAGVVTVPSPRAQMAVGTLQAFLDAYTAQAGGRIDYIHGAEVARELASVPDAVAFFLPPMEKRELFPTVIFDGELPRKTFSMGHAEEKRYYLEARRIG